MAGKSLRLTLSPAHLLSTEGPYLARGDLAVYSRRVSVRSPFYFLETVNNISLSQETQSLKFNQLRFSLSMDCCENPGCLFHVDDSRIYPL